jgi:hypothetical protein
MQEDEAPEPKPPEEAVSPADEDEHLPDEGPDGYTTSDFHNVVQKHIVNATYEALVDTKLHWDLIEPFLLAAREICRGDFVRTGRVGIHGAAAAGDGWAEAEEAYVSLSIADQDDGLEWLSQTWWLSDLVLAEADPARVRDAARALERTVAKLDLWLEANAKGPAEGG